MKDVENFRHKSHIIKHWLRDQKDLVEPSPFTFRVTSMFKDCLSRQIGEALRIFFSQDTILNSKSEYLDNCITRLTVEESQWERKERERRMRRFKRSYRRLRWKSSEGWLSHGERHQR